MPAALRDLVLASVKAKALKKASPLLYLAGADLARDLAGELGERGFTVVTHTTYRMAPVAGLPRETSDAFAANRIEAVLHYSRRSARAFLEAARAAGVEIIGAVDPAMLHFRRRRRGGPRRRGDPGHGGGLAGRKCPVRGVGPCVAAGIARKKLPNPLIAGRNQRNPEMAEDRPEEVEIAAGSGPRQARAADHRPGSHGNIRRNPKRRRRRRGHRKFRRERQRGTRRRRSSGGR